MRTTAPRSSSQASAAARPPVGLAHRLGRLAAAVAVATVAAVVVPVGAATPAQASVTQSIVPWAGSTDVMDPSGAMGFGQTFVPGTAMVLESASLTLSGVSEPRPELSVCPTDGVGLPVSCTAATSTSMSNGVVTGTFSGTPVILAAGTRYAVVVQVRDVSGLYSYYGSTALTYLTSDVYAAGAILFGYENQAGQRDILWGSAIDYGAPTADLPLSVTYSTPAAPAITSTTLPGGSLGQPYSQTLTATGSPAPSWGVSGPLPAGLTLSPGGVLSGTPTAVGSTTFTLIATNGVAPQATQSFTVTIAAVAPSAPASVTLAPADHAVTATWPASTSTGGAPPVSYEVEYQATGDAGWTSAGSTTALTAPIGGLTTGTEYTVRVRATTTAGASAWTASTALVLPGTPTVSSTSAVATNAGAVVTWTGDDHGSAVSQADVAYRLVGDATWTSTTDTVTAADGSHTFAGLTNRAMYEYSVTLRNAIGTSAPATGTFTPFLLAGSLTSDGTALASAPRLAGAPVTGHATGLPTGRSVDLVWAPGTADETVLDTGVADASGEATLTGSIPTGAAAGQHTVTIRPTGGTATVTSTVTITLPTTVYWAPTTARYGQSYSSTIVLGGESTTVTLVQGLPAGLTWNAAGAISGTPTQVGSFTVSVTADGVGGTRLYAATLTVEAVAPGVVTGMASTTGLSTPGRIDLSWPAPSTTGAPGPLTYTVRYRPVGSSAWATLTTGGTTATISSLAVGGNYEVGVTATNSANLSGPQWTTQIPVWVASVVSALTATPADGSATLAWATSTGGWPAEKYVVTLTAGGTSTTQVVAPSALGTTLTGLTNGTSYTATVVACTAFAGLSCSYGTPDTVTFTPATVPGAPTIGTATGGEGRATVTWQAPADDGGSPVTGFRVDHRAVGSATWTSGDVVTPTATQATITGLTDAVTYELRLVAINAAGAGAASATVTATPFRFTPGYTTATGAPLDMQAMTAGTVITMSGSGATPGATIVLELHSDPIVLGTTVVAADGTYRLTVTLPAGVTGSHTLVATMAGVAPVGTAVGVVSATAPAAAAATGTNATAASAAAARPAARSTVRSAALAATGTDPEPLAAAAWVLILAGAGALALARARRARPTR